MVTKWWMLGCLCFLCLTTQRAGAQTSPSLDARVNVFVSILPQAYFLERVGGHRVKVSVMVGPGQSPHTYEPTPKQMANLGKARLYFRTGVEFENAWMDRITQINPRLKVIDARRGIEILPMAAHRDHDDNSHVHHGNELKDPHIWLSLRLAKIQALTICDALAAEEPRHEPYFRKNLEAFRHDLDRLDGEINETLQAARIHKFMVLHPAWGYFARDYGLEQIPIEIEGKEPNAKDLARIIKEATGKADDFRKPPEGGERNISRHRNSKSETRNLKQYQMTKIEKIKNSLFTGQILVHYYSVLRCSNGLEHLKICLWMFGYN
jgi:zinc transport system substrate-binding protein